MARVLIADDHPLFRDAIRGVVAQVFADSGWEFSCVEAATVGELSTFELLLQRGAKVQADGELRITGCQHRSVCGVGFADHEAGAGEDAVRCRLFEQGQRSGMISPAATPVHQHLGQCDLGIGHAARRRTRRHTDLCCWRPTPRNPRRPPRFPRRSP